MLEFGESISKFVVNELTRNGDRVNVKKKIIIENSENVLEVLGEFPYLILFDTRPETAARQVYRYSEQSKYLVINLQLHYLDIAKSRSFISARFET